MAEQKKTGINGWSWKGALFFFGAVAAAWILRAYVEYTLQPVEIHPRTDGLSVMNVMDAAIVFIVSWMAPIFTAMALYAFWVGPGKSHSAWMKA